jgi:hypothetical protein
MELENFNDVMKSLNKKREKDHRKIHLLMGNGFSIAYDKDIFSYKALEDFIHKQPDEVLKKLFDITQKSDFEYIMKELDYFTQIANTFGKDPELPVLLNQTQVKLKKSLIEAVEASHPEYVFSIPEEKCNKCAAFFSRFLDSDGEIFSTNYDLLLYWVLMRADILKDRGIDGFGKSVLNYDEVNNSDDYNLSNLEWGNNNVKQNIHYVHGALHLFDTGTEIEKEEYDNGHYLLENIEKRMKNGHYPLFVTGGTSEEKLDSIQHNQYLSFCYNRLQKITGSLVVFGFKFGDNDKHIIRAINKAAIFDRNRNSFLCSVYIGVFSDDDKKHIEDIADQFKCKKVHIFDAKTANIWN